MFVKLVLALRVAQIRLVMPKHGLIFWTRCCRKKIRKKLPQDQHSSLRDFGFVIRIIYEHVKTIPTPLKEEWEI